MADELLAVVPPKTLLDMAAKKWGAPQLMDAVLTKTAVNKRYRREAVQVWASLVSHDDPLEPEDGLNRLTDRHVAYIARDLASTDRPPVEHDDQAIGRLLCELGIRRLEAMPVVVAPVASADAAARLHEILVQCGRIASMDKHGDRMLHTLLKLNLPAHWLASLASEPPYQALNTVYGPAVNEMVNKWIETPIDQAIDAVDLDGTDPDALVVAGSLLAEVLDEMPSFPAINTELVAKEGPALFVFCQLGDLSTPDCYGYMTAAQTLVVAPETRPVASVILAWAADLASRELHTALTEPTRLPGDSKLKEWLVS